jgi:HlyD family secretion protein
MIDDPRRPTDDVRRYTLIGLAGALLLAGSVAGWAATSSFAGAVMAPGTVVVDSNVKKVQHPTGGVVGEILVKDGDRVEAGDVVIRLDATMARANLGVINAQLDELAGRMARLKAERDGADSIDLPAGFANRQSTPEVAEIMAGERRLFGTRQASRIGQKAQLTERINQLSQEVRGLEALYQAKSRELDLVTIELTENRKLWNRNLIPLAKYTALQREETRIAGERSQLVATIARSRAAIAETHLQIIGIDHEHATEVMKDLRDTQAKVSELAERQAASEDMLRRIEIRAPNSGIVHQLNVHTVGGVIGPGEQIMQIVPGNEALVIEARIAARDIDQLHVGQEVFVRFTASNQSTTPDFRGSVLQVAADATKDPQSGDSYFVARLGLVEGELNRHGNFRIVPGMSAENYIRTLDRTPLSYLLKPLSDQVERTFRER